MVECNVAVVIPMAGSGQRFSSSPKQYVKVMGKPLFMFCTEEFYKLPYVKKICLVSDRVDFVQNIVEENFKKQEKIIVVAGGQTRHMSIKNGLNEINKSDESCKVVVIHDGARPFVPEDLLIKVINGAMVNGAAGATRPLISTILKPKSDGSLEASLDRKEYVMSETPQAFMLPLIMTAYMKCSQEDLENGTECLELTLKYCGVNAKLIPGPDTLWKVTEKRDIHCIAPYLKEKSIDVCIMSREENEVMLKLKEALAYRVSKVECLITGNDTIPKNQTYNFIVCLHDKDIDQESQMQKFGTVLDVDREGLVIHVLEHSSSDGMQSTSVYELHRTGRTMTKHYEKLKKGVVMIHCLSQGEEKRLIDLILNLIFSDAQAISGQTLFL